VNRNEMRVPWSTTATNFDVLVKNNWIRCISRLITIYRKVKFIPPPNAACLLPYRPNVVLMHCCKVLQSERCSIGNSHLGKIIMLVACSSTPDCTCWFAVICCDVLSKYLPHKTRIRLFCVKSMRLFFFFRWTLRFVLVTKWRHGW